MKLGMGLQVLDISTLPGPSRPGGGVKPVDPTVPTSFLQLENSTFSAFVSYLAELENSNFVIGLEN